jgi:hypothetical protein
VTGGAVIGRNGKGAATDQQQGVGAVSQTDRRLESTIRNSQTVIADSRQFAT